MKHIKKYKKFESLNSEFDNLDLDLDNNDKKSLGWFIDELEDQPSILSELKYRLTDGEDPIEVVKDICDNKLGYETHKEQVAQHRGRLFVSSATFTKNKNDDPDEFEAHQVGISIAYMYDSQGLDEVIKMLDGKSVKGLLPYLDGARKSLSDNQDIMTWANQITRKEKPSTINQKKIDLLDNLIDAINNLDNGEY